MDSQSAVIALMPIGLMANIFFAFLMTYFLSEQNYIDNPAPKWYRIAATVLVFIPYAWMFVAAVITVVAVIVPISKAVVVFLKTGEF